MKKGKNNRITEVTAKDLQLIKSSIEIDKIWGFFSFSFFNFNVCLPNDILIRLQDKVSSVLFESLGSFYSEQTEKLKSARKVLHD